MQTFRIDDHVNRGRQIVAPFDVAQFMREDRLELRLSQTVSDTPSGSSSTDLRILKSPGSHLPGQDITCIGRITNALR